MSLWKGLVLQLLSLACVTGAVPSIYGPPMESCGHTIGPFYWTDVIFGPNSTDFVIASIQSTKSEPTAGELTIFNDPLRSGPTEDDPLLGRAQGIFGITDPDLASGPGTFTFIFSDGTITFNGYFLKAYFDPPAYNRIGISTGNGRYQDITRGYADISVYSTDLSGLPEVSYILNGTITYCVAA